VATTITAFFDRYRKAFESHDLDAMAKLVHLPCLVMSGRGVVAVTSREELDERLGRQFAHNQEAELDHARVEVVAHRRLTPRFVDVDVAWELLRADGEVIRSFGVKYTLTAPESGWRVAVVTPVDIHSG
jgi:limonene-1,2-epoxide hydrolase